MDIFLFIVVLLCLVVQPVWGIISCENDTVCQEFYRNHLESASSSVCIDGKCSNPFRSGCLRQYLSSENELAAAEPLLRTCNSEDPPNAAAEELGICKESLLDYPEIRIASENWESAIFTAWVLQILLSELLDVPVTIETSHPEFNLNFYNPQMTDYDPLLHYGDHGEESYDWSALKTAKQYDGDCRLAAVKNESSCAHVIPEVWDAGIVVAEQRYKDLFEPPTGSGVLGKLGWFIPKFTVEKHPSLLSYFGMTTTNGPQEGYYENRRKMAQIFKRPWTYGRYCAEISPNNCTISNNVAQRPPISREEASKYFINGIYTGFFHPTDDNDCDRFPLMNCTGHIIDAPCGYEFDTMVTAQAYHLGIPVKSNGPLSPNGGYEVHQMVDIVKAANATQSDILLYWWTPDVFLNSFVGTNFELQHVYLPMPTEECLLSRVPLDQRCSSNFQELVGSKEGACDSQIQRLQTLIVSNLNTNTYAKEEADRSPAYEAIKGFSITNVAIQRMMQYGWGEEQQQQKQQSMWKENDPRDAVCRWTSEHLHELKEAIPRGYPRSIRDEGESYYQPYLQAAMAFGIGVSLLVVATSVAIFVYRKEKVMVFAQVNFMYMLLFGLLFVCLGATVYTIVPSDWTCQARQWLILLGYSLELVPLIVKISAINRLLRASRQMRRAQISQQKLYATVGSVLGLVVVFLTIWTIVDPPRVQEERTLTKEFNAETGGEYLEITPFCSSQSSAWKIVVLTYQLILLAWATALAIQTRNVRQEFNESTWLAFVVYSHFVLGTAQQAAMWFLYPNFGPKVSAAISSFLLSFDSIVTLGIYFGPKLLAAHASAKRLSATTYTTTVFATSNTTTSVPQAVTIEKSGGGDSDPTFAPTNNSNSGFSL